MNVFALTNREICVQIANNPSDAGLLAVAAMRLAAQTDQLAEALSSLNHIEQRLIVLARDLEGRDSGDELSELVTAVGNVMEIVRAG